MVKTIACLYNVPNINTMNSILHVIAIEPFRESENIAHHIFVSTVLISYNARIIWSFELLPTTIRKRSNLCQTLDFIVEALITVCLCGWKALIAIKIRVSCVCMQNSGGFYMNDFKRDTYIFKSTKNTCKSVPLKGNHVLVEYFSC